MSEKNSQFRLNRLAAMITAGMLLHACSSLPDGGVSDEAVIEDNDAFSFFEPVRAIWRPAPPPRVVIAPNPVSESLGAHDDLWFRIRDGLSFALDHDNPRVLQEMSWYAGNPEYLAQISERATPFLYEIVEEIHRRHLPMELALLPVIESAFNPTASSPQNAAGLWQFMSATGNSLGLKQDWWYDGRLDPIASTLAALDYLETLYNRFDQDWLLALAAYNAGQGTVQKAISTNQSRKRATDFWSLPLPRETLAHVPKLLGLARLIADPAAHSIELPIIANKPAVMKFDLGRQVDLALAAQMAGLEPEVVYRLNPGFRQWATHPDGPHELLIPVSHADSFTAALAQLPPTESVTWDRYVVQSGDTLGAIAQRFRTRVNVLQDVNGLNNSRIIAGESLLIPRSMPSGAPITAPNAPVYLTASATPTSAPSPTYQVRSGDSLWLIANRHNVSIDALMAMNGLDDKAVLRPGQVLHVQPAAQRTAQAETVVSPEPSLQMLQYQVRRGDTLSQIARRHNVKIDDLTEWNDIKSNAILRPGQHLMIHLPPAGAAR